MKRLVWYGLLWIMDHGPVCEWSVN